MREVLRIGTIFRRDVGEALFDQLVAVYPPGRTGTAGHGFRARLLRQDPRADAVVQCLAGFGYSPWMESWRPLDRSCEFIMEIERNYDDTELSSFDWLELRPSAGARNIGAIERGRKDGNGPLIVPERQMPEDPYDFYYGHFTWVFVPDRVKRMLEVSNLRGIALLPTYFAPNDMNATDTDETIRTRHGTPYWEIDSMCTMPPLSAHMTIVDSTGHPASRGASYENGFLRREGLYLHPELHYRAIDLRGLDSDLYRTFEVFGNRRGVHGRRHSRPPLDQPLIASRRFYEFCVANRLKVNWVPVRTDPD